MMMERNKFARGPWTLQGSGSVVCPDHTLQNTPVLPPDGSWKDSCSLRRDLRNFIRDLCRVRLPCRLWHSRRRLQVLRHRVLRLTKTEVLRLGFTHRKHEGRYQGAIISQGHSVTCFKEAQRVMEERAGFNESNACISAVCCDQRPDISFCHDVDGGNPVRTPS